MKKGSVQEFGRRLRLLVGPIERLDLSVDFQNVSIRIAEEQRPMTPRLISWPRNDFDATLCENGSAFRDLGGRDPECHLERQSTWRWRGVVENESAFRKCQEARPDTT